MSPASSAEPQAGTHPAARAAAAQPGDQEGDRAEVRSPAVHTMDLRKHYRRTVALAGLSMTVGQGEVFGFLGP